MQDDPITTMQSPPARAHAGFTDAAPAVDLLQALYDEATAFLSERTETLYLVTAADVLVYIGALASLFHHVAVRLTSGGLFAFTVEEATDGDLVLRDSLRYAHSETYIRRVLAEAGLAVAALARDTLRYDRGAPIRGLIVVAELSA